MSYRHTQRGPMYLLPLAGAVVFALMLWRIPMPPVTRVMPAVAIVVFVGMAFCFQTLTVEDTGAHLSLRYGPLPVFRKRIAYVDMTDVKRSRSKVVDGWGIHCVVGRGWTWNLWGFDCVELRVKGTTYRIGSDDADALARFLQSRALPA